MDAVLVKVLEVLENGAYNEYSIKEKRDMLNRPYYSLETYKNGIIKIRRIRHRNWTKKIFKLKDKVTIVVCTCMTEEYEINVIEETVYYKILNNMYEKIEKIKKDNEIKSVLKYL